ELFSSVDSKVEIWQRNRLKTVPQFIRTNQFRDIGFPDGEFFGSVTTLQEWSDMLGQCSLRHRFPVCSSGGYSNRKSFFWRLVGICVFPCRTGTSRSCSPSEVCTPIHVTVWRWVQRYAPEMERRLRSRLRPTNDSWRADETYIRVKGKWVYLYRAVDSSGATIDF